MSNQINLGGGVNNPQQNPSPDSTQNAQEHEKVCALCLTVGGGHNDPTCPAKHSDTQKFKEHEHKWVNTRKGSQYCYGCDATKHSDKQNDTSELEAQLDGVLGALDSYDRDIPKAKQALTTLIAQREQAADRKTLETVATLLNGDSNQLEVVKNYVWNKLKMYSQKEAE